MISILVVDDEPGILNVCRRILQSKEYNIYTAKNGEEAWEFLKNAIVDIVMLDIRMPRVDGIELLKKIKKYYPSIEVIMMTADSQIDISIECLKNGAFDYILKPFNVDEITQSVEKTAEYIKLKTNQKILNEITALYQIYHEADKSKTLLLKEVLKCAVNSLEADSGSILLITEKKTLKIAAVYGAEINPDTEIKIGDRISGWVAQKNKPILIQNGFSNMPQFEDLEVRAEIVSSIVSPLTRHDTLLGVICLNRLKKKNSAKFTQNELDSFQVFVTHASIITSMLTNALADL